MRSVVYEIMNECGIYELKWVRVQYMRGLIFVIDCSNFRYTLSCEIIKKNYEMNQPV